MMRAERWVYPRGLIDPPVDVEPPAGPLRLYEKGVWDPAEQYWGEPDDMVEMCLVEVIAVGPRMQYEFEQLLPGGDNPDPGDPILDAVELRNRGYPDRARALLEGLVDWDERCIDAHAHLGGFAFGEDDIEEGGRTTPPGYGSPRPRCPTDSAACSAGAGSTTALSHAAYTA